MTCLQTSQVKSSRLQALFTKGSGSELPRRATLPKTFVRLADSDPRAFSSFLNICGIFPLPPPMPSTAADRARLGRRLPATKS